MSNSQGEARVQTFGEAKSSIIDVIESSFASLAKMLGVSKQVKTCLGFLCKMKTKKRKSRPLFQNLRLKTTNLRNKLKHCK